jgi:hypothetical protein
MPARNDLKRFISAFPLVHEGGVLSTELQPRISRFRDMGVEKYLEV